MGPGLRRLSGLAAGIVLGAAAVLGYQYTVAPAGGLTAEQGAALQADAARGRADTQFLRSQLDTADGELAVERAARRELDEQMRAAQADAGQLRDRLAFYEQLLPPGPEGTVDVRRFDLESQPQGLRYRVLLMRSGRAGSAPFVGTLQFMAEGVKHGENVTIELTPLQSRGDEPAPAAREATSGVLALDFDQYQRNQGVLGIPDDFVPVSVTVNVLEGTVVRASRVTRLSF